MKSMATSAVLAALLAGTVALPVAAAERNGGTNQRQNAQQNRIEQGVQQGDLTRGEASRLRGETRSVRREETAFRADGRLSAGERRHLNRDFNRTSRNIYRQRHDAQRRFGYRSSGRHFASRGQGQAFGRHGADRRFSGHGATQRFGSRGEHPRFGNQWGHRSFNSRVNRMQAQQHRSIARGVRSGQLTSREARRLYGQQRAIQHRQRAYLADGRLSRGERRVLSRDLRSANRRIYNQTHDAQRRR